jgi:hypothetical protein
MATPITNEELKAIIDEKITNKNTRYQYQRRLNILLTLLKTWQEQHDTDKRKDDSTLVLWCMLHPRKCFPVVSQAYESVQTVANMITFILSLFKYADLKCKYDSPYKRWLAFHGEVSDRIEKQYKSNEPTETQRDKYLTFAEMQTVLHNMSASQDPHRTRDLSVDYCLIAMYAEIAPLRSDFGKIRVYTKDREFTHKNYVVLGDQDGESYFVINHYNKTQMAKNGKMKPPKRIEISKALRNTFVDSCKRWPRKYLFVSRRGHEFETSSAYSKFVIAVYKKHFGKPVGTSMLRHIYITEKVNANNLSVAERDNIADAMGHSRNMQDMYKLFVKQ